jgi:hypothetical protein
MKEYLNDTKFLNFLKLLGVDFNNTSENELNDYYLIYKSQLDALLKNIDVIYNNVLNDDFNADFEKKLDNLLSVDLNSLSETEVNDLIFKTSSFKIINGKMDSILLYKKLSLFFKKNNMKLYELDIESKNNIQIVTETWIHRKTGYSLITTYQITEDTFNILDNNMKKYIINKQHELNNQIYDFEIDSLPKEDKIKYYNKKLNLAISTEAYEEAAKYRDIIKLIDVN